MEIAKLKKEFMDLREEFSTMYQKTLSIETKEMLSTSNLYEIEPFFMEIKNEVPTEVSFLTSIDDYSPENNELYLYHVHMEAKKILFKKHILSGDINYSSIYEYHGDYYRSATIYANKELVKPISLSYLFFQNGMPHKYIEVTEHGMSIKEYTAKENLLIGYKESFVIGDSNEIIYSSDVDFFYDGNFEINKIERSQNQGKRFTVYKKFFSNESVDNAFKKIETYLATQIAKQIQDNVKIATPVYTILLEYSLQNIFPPTIGIGLDSEKDDATSYNAPDMFHFSEKSENEEGHIKIDLYDAEMQDAYLFISTEYKKSDFSENFQEKIYTSYLNIIKKLSNVDFSSSFPSSNDFLIMARDFEECNEEKFYSEMKKHKNSLKC